MQLTDNERLELWGMRHAFSAADVSHATGEFTQGITDLLEGGDANAVYRTLAGIEQVKGIFQQMHHFNHTVGLLAAKAFLQTEFPDLAWEDVDFAAHANKPGPDVHIEQSIRIIAELKTTQPCGRTRSGNTPVKFGSNQKTEIEKDLRNLSSSEYDTYARYMFVTSPLAYHCLVRDYRAAFPNVCFVLLSAMPEVSRPVHRGAGE